MCLLNDGPFVYAIGGVGRPDFTVETALMPDGKLELPVCFTDDGGCVTLAPLTAEEMREPLARPVLKASGVARASNSAKSTIFAALLAQDFIQKVNGQPGFDPNRVVIGICNCSASAAISWEYETEGVTMGWLKTNTMLMPSALPSAIGTQISAAIKTHNATITFLNDILGMCSALEYTHINFFHKRADYAFIIAAEEMSVPHAKTTAHINENLVMERDGASGVLLSRNMLTGPAWQLAICRHVADAGEFSLPEGWNEAKVLRLNLKEHKAAFSSLLLPYALHHLFSSGGHDKAVLLATVENRSTYALGFQLVSKA